MLASCYLAVPPNCVSPYINLWLYTSLCDRLNIVSVKHALNKTSENVKVNFASCVFVSLNAVIDIQCLLSYREKKKVVIEVVFRVLLKDGELNI